MVQRFANTAGVSRLAYEMMNSSFADYMQALRLDACRRDFQSHEHAARSITDIAVLGLQQPGAFLAGVSQAVRRESERVACARLAGGGLIQASSSGSPSG